jgi:hypothetical protein
MLASIARFVTGPFAAWYVKDRPRSILWVLSTLFLSPISFRLRTQYGRQTAADLRVAHSTTNATKMNKSQENLAKIEALFHAEALQVCAKTH